MQKRTMTHHAFSKMAARQSHFRANRTKNSKNDSDECSLIQPIPKDIGFSRFSFGLQITVTFYRSYIVAVSL